MSRYNNSQVEKKSTPGKLYNMKSPVPLSIFNLLWKKVQTKALPWFHWEIVQRPTLYIWSFLIVSDGANEFVGNLSLVRIESIWIAKLMTVDAHLNRGKSWVQNGVYKSNKMK